MSMGAGIASCGKIPVVNSFGIFSTGRAWEMVRQDISYPRLNVKIIGSHTGIALGEYGVSHQSIADVGAMRILPHVTVIEPSDAIHSLPSSLMGSLNVILVSAVIGDIGSSQQIGPSGPLLGQSHAGLEIKGRLIT